MRVLVTRPEPDNARTAAALRERGHAVLLAPLLRFEPMDDAAVGPGPFAALLVTSANALRAIAERPERHAWRGLPVFAVGERTAAAARAAGFTRVRSAGGNARDLAALVTRIVPGAPFPLLHLAGEDHVDLAPDLRASGIAVETAVVYRMRAAAAFPAEVADAIARGEVDAVLHYSRRAVQAFLACARVGAIEPAALLPAQFCLSAGVAALLRDAGARRISVALQPNEDALLRLVP